MGGGHWNYEQFKVYELGERLSKECDVALAAIGRDLMRASAWIDDADRCYSGDGSSWNEKTRDEALRAMAPIAIEVMQERSEALLEVMLEIRKLLDSPAVSK